MNPYSFGRRFSPRPATNEHDLVSERGAGSASLIKQRADKSRLEYVVPRTRRRRPAPCARGLPFGPGELVVCAPYGVAHVASVARERLCGIEDVFVRLHFVVPELLLSVPARRISKLGIRPLVDKSTAKRVLCVFKEQAHPPSGASWSRRMRDCFQELLDADVFATARVLRDLWASKMQKSLSLTEQRLFDMAKNLLLSELSAVTGQDAAQLSRRIEKLIVANRR